MGIGLVQARGRLSDGVRASCCDGLRGRSGQLTVEFAVGFPVMIVVAIIATNAVLFFGDCAVFDRAFREAVRVYATSPAYEQTVQDSKELITEALSETMSADRLVVGVAVESVSGGHTCFTGTVQFKPTLFGLNLKSSVFGVELPSLSHSTSLVVDCYKPGVLV